MGNRQMTSRELVLKTLEFQEPERIPRQLGPAQKKTLHFSFTPNGIIPFTMESMAI